MSSLVSGAGEEIEGFTCQACDLPIVYNGNYFCPQRGEDDGRDHFVLDETQAAWRAIGYDMYVQLMKQRGKEPKTLEDTMPPDDDRRYGVVRR